VNSLLQKVFESDWLLSMLLFKIAPGQVAVVEQVNEDIHDRLHVVAARFVVTPARVERCEQEVACELVLIFFLHVLFGQAVNETLGKPKIDQV